MGFRLADICRMLSFYDDRQRLDECLAAQQAALEAQAEDVARAIAFLAAEESGYITGQVLCVDGGMAM